VISGAERPGESVDVSGLPAYAFGVRDSMWWGALLLVVIEASAMALMLVSTLYLRGNYDVWPPVPVGRPALRLAVVQLVLLAASALPMLASVRAARRQRLRPARLWLVVATALGVAMLVVRGFEIPRIQFRWDANAYGSAFWMTFGLHVTHVVTGVIENLVMTALFFMGPVERKHFGDLEASSLLWFFTVIEWFPAFAILYVVPLLQGR
jgi:cytochrome c oxidase subunit III